MSEDTRSFSSHDVWDELAAGAALHALEPDEQLAFDLHADHCARCRQSLADNELIAAQLGSLSSGTDDSEGPPQWSSMRTAILGAAAADTADTGDTKGLRVARAGIPNAEAGDELAAARRRHAQRFTTSRRALASAAAVVALIGGGVAVWGLQHRGGSGPCAGLSNCHDVELQSSKGANIAEVVVRGDVATVRPNQLGPAPSGKTYVLWQLTRSDSPIAIAQWNGRSSMQTPLERSFSNTAVFAVSEEKSGDIPAKPSTVVATSPAN